jgi:hypothetical protein
VSIIQAGLRRVFTMGEGYLVTDQQDFQCGETARLVIETPGH